MSRYSDPISINDGSHISADDILSVASESPLFNDSLNSLAVSDDKYRTIFESIDEGYLLCKIIFDTDNKPVDAIFLDTNTAFEFVSGIKVETGSTLKQILPDIQPFWISIPALVVKMGRAIRHVGYVSELNRWLDVHFFRVGSESDHTVAVLINNITERKQNEANVRFLADVTSQFTKHSASSDILKTIGEMVASYFDVSRCHFSDIDDAGLIEVFSDWHIDSLDAIVVEENLFIRNLLNEKLYSQLQNGEVVVIHDLKKDDRIDAGCISKGNLNSYIMAPILKDGMLKFCVTVSGIHARKWRQNEINLMRELASRIWLSLERIRAEEALRISEHRYRKLFETMDEGFAVCELIRDSKGNAVDYRFLQLNPASEKITGFKVEETLGQLATKIVPGLDSWWMKKYQTVVDTGVSNRFEQYVPQLGKWFDVNAFHYGGNNFALLYDDITKRKQSEEILVKRRENKALIIKLSDKINAMENPFSILKEASVLLGNQLRVNRVVFTEFNAESVSIYTGYCEGVKSITGTYPITISQSEIADMWKEEGVFSVNDVSTDSRISKSHREMLGEFEVVSFVSIGMFRSNRIKASLSFQSAVSREWTPDEIALLAEASERTWAAVERARVVSALRKSEEQYLIELETEVHQRTSELFASKEQYSSLVENTPDIITRWDKKFVLIYANSAFESISGVSTSVSIGTELKEIVTPIEIYTSYRDSLKKVFDEGQPVVYYNSCLTAEGERYYYSRIVPERNKNGEVETALSIARDITEFKRAEQEILELKLRQHREIMNTVLATQEQERERIGESLHNGIAQLLYGIQTRMELINPKTDSDEKNINDVLTITRDAINDIRRLSFELVPIVLKDFGIEVALRSLLGRIVTGKPEFDLEFTGIAKRLPDHIEFAIYRIVQELVNNILKHSKASTAKIELVVNKNEIVLKVTDNGVGVALNTDKLLGGIGLKSVKNRVHLLGGTMIFHPVKVGTSVEISFEM